MYLFSPQGIQQFPSVYSSSDSLKNLSWTSGTQYEFVLNCRYLDRAAYQDATSRVRQHAPNFPDRAVRAGAFKGEGFARAEPKN